MATFQSTRPVWGATTRWRRSRASGPDFNPRAPCGARPHCISRPSSRSRFQSTRPVWGATIPARHPTTKEKFQSTRPVWGATYDGPTDIMLNTFQSTRPVWGATRKRRRRSGRCRNFNPRAPCGARQIADVEIMIEQIFQSTRPVWGATGANGVMDDIHTFQSTRPVWGATANLTILPRQICTKGTKEFLLGRKTHEKKEK